MGVDVKESVYAPEESMDMPHNRITPKRKPLKALATWTLAVLMAAACSNAARDDALSGAKSAADIEDQAGAGNDDADQVDALAHSADIASEVTGDSKGSGDDATNDADVANAQIDATVDASPPPQRSPLANENDCPGGVFCDCKSNADCDQGLCWEGPYGLECAHVGCMEQCLPGYYCGFTGSCNWGSDVIIVCKSRLARMCRPCSGDADCNFPGGSAKFCHGFGPEGSFCTSACSSLGSDIGCPTGYTCSAKICVPKSGQCACDAMSVQAGASTQCTVAPSDVAPGGPTPTCGCVGSRACTSSGLSACALPLNAECTPANCP